MRPAERDLRLMVLALLSAAISGWLLAHLREAAGALTASSLLFTAIYGLVRG